VPRDRTRYLSLYVGPARSQASKLLWIAHLLKVLYFNVPSIDIPYGSMPVVSPHIAFVWSHRASGRKSFWMFWLSDRLDARDSLHLKRQVRCTYGEPWPGLAQPIDRVGNEQLARGQIIRFSNVP
jgi:hypothetical protein